MDFHVTGDRGQGVWNIGSERSEGANQATTNVGALWGDTIDKAGPEGLLFLRSYTQPSSSPSPPPPRDPSTLNDQPPESAAHARGSASETTFAQEAYTTVERYTGEEGLLREEPWNFSDGQVEEVIFYHETGLTPDDPQVRAALAAIDGEIEGIAEAWDFPTPQDQENWRQQLNDSKGPYARSLQRVHKHHFEQELQSYGKEHGLSEEEMAQLRFLHNNPEYLDPDSDAAGMLSTIEADALAETERVLGFTLPEDAPLVDKEGSNAAIDAGHPAAYRAVVRERIANGEIDVEALAAETGLSEEEVTSYLIHHLNGNEILDAEIENVDGIVMENVRAEHGIVGDFPIEADYQGVLNEDFQRIFYRNLTGPDSDLTPDERDAVMAMLEEPVDPEIVNHPIFLKTVEEVRGLNNLPDTWMPAIDGLSSLRNLDPGRETIWRFLDYNDEFMNEAILFVTGLPDGPQKAVLLNFLKIISDAIALLKEKITEMMIENAQLNKELSEVRMETALNKVAEQKKKMDEAKEKNPFKQFLEGVGKIFEWMGPVGRVLLGAVLGFMFGGPAGLAVALAVGILVEAAPDAVKAVFEGLIDFCCKIFGDKFGALVGMVLILALMLKGGSAFLAGGGLQLFALSGAAERFFIDTCGMDKQDAMIAAMVMIIVVELAASAAMAKAASTTGQAADSLEAAESTASTYTRAADMADQVGAHDLATKWRNTADQITTCSNDVKDAQGALKAAEKTGDANEIAKAQGNLAEKQQALDNKLAEVDGQLAKKFEKWAVKFEAGGNIASGVIQISSAIEQARLEMRLAEIDAEIEMLTAMIKVLQKLIESVLQGGTELADWLGYTGEQQDRSYNEKSMTLSGIYEQAG
ncbi:MAG: hypothetical protein WB791_04920 [Waddliaceae bacterium]